MLARRATAKSWDVGSGGSALPSVINKVPKTGPEEPPIMATQVLPMVLSDSCRPLPSISASLA